MAGLPLVPDACTLPTVDQPVRLAEWDELFAAAISVERVDERQGRLTFADASGLAARVRDLSRRETSCCSFFDFSIGGGADTSGHPTVTLGVGVPVSRVDVLDAWLTWADDVRRGHQHLRGHGDVSGHQDLRGRRRVVPS